MTSYEILDRTVTLPVEVRDASTATVLFEVDAAAATELIGTDQFAVVEASPGTAQMVLAFIDYRDNDLGDYLEVGVNFFVTPTAAPDAEQGTYIYKLPVDQEFTCVAGNTIWGFPKSVESISMVREGGRLKVTLDMDGERVLSADLPADGDDEMPRMDLVTYSLKDGAAHATTFSQGGTGAAVGVDGDATVEFGPHPLGKAIEALGLSAPVMTTWTEHMSATFSDAAPVA